MDTLQEDLLMKRVRMWLWVRSEQRSLTLARTSVARRHAVSPAQPRQCRADGETCLGTCDAAVCVPGSGLRGCAFARGVWRGGLWPCCGRRGGTVAASRVRSASAARPRLVC